MRCAVLGSPIAHSLSPVLHHAAYAELGMDWRYDALEVTEDSLRGFVESLGPQWRGLSLTMPLKRAVVPLLDETDDLVRRTGAANTVLREPEGRLVGRNTDVPGIQAALAGHGLAPASALIVGGGATATSAVVALEQLGCTDITLAVRHPARAADAVAAGTSVRVVHLREPAGPVDLLLSTVPAAAQEGLLQDAVRRAGAVFDVTYDPWPTPFAVAASSAGRPVVAGLDLLVHQAVLQVELMTGRVPAPLDVMRAAGLRALSMRR